MCFEAFDFALFFGNVATRVNKRGVKRLSQLGKKIRVEQKGGN